MTCFYVTFMSLLGNYFYSPICHRNNRFGSQFNNCDWKPHYGLSKTKPYISILATLNMFEKVSDINHLFR